MKDNRLKEQVMKDVREALMERNIIGEGDNHIPDGKTFLAADGNDLSVTFAKNFTAAGGIMYYCYNEQDIMARIKEIQKSNNDEPIACASDNLNTFLGHLDIKNKCSCNINERHPFGAILCEALLAWNGSVVLSSNQGIGTSIASLFSTTIVLAFTSQVVPDWEIAHERIKNLYDRFPDNIVITNPSAQSYRKGQQKIYLILIEDETN